MATPTDKETSRDRGGTQSERESGAERRSTAGTSADTGAEAERPINVSTETRTREREGRVRDRGQAVQTFRPALAGRVLSPFDLMRRMSEEMSRVFGVAPLFAPDESEAFDLSTGPAAFVPQIEVVKQSNALLVRADLPGTKPDDITVNVADGLLTIRGERRQEQREKGDGYVRSEVSYGTFTRAIPLPDNASEDQIAASFRDGVLEITVPISGQERGRRIPVKSER